MWTTYWTCLQVIINQAFSYSTVENNLYISCNKCFLIMLSRGDNRALSVQWTGLAKSRDKEILLHLLWSCMYWPLGCIPHCIPCTYTPLYFWGKGGNTYPFYIENILYAYKIYISLRISFSSSRFHAFTKKHNSKYLLELRARHRDNTHNPY